MKKSVFSVFCSMVLLIAACNENGSTDDTSKKESIPGNLFPLTVNNRMEYGGYLTNGSTDSIVPGSDNLLAVWRIIGDTSLSSVYNTEAVSHLSKSSATIIVDSLSVPGILTQVKVSPVLVYIDNVNGNFYYLLNFGNAFRTYLMYDNVDTRHIRSDSLRFIKLLQSNAAIGEDYTVFKEAFQSYIAGLSPLPLLLEIVGNVQRTENLTMNVNGKDTTFKAYYLTVTNIPTLGAFKPEKTISAKFWLAEKIGPVQMFLAGDDEGPGSFRRLSKKNF